MSLPDARTLYAVTEATWPPARVWREGPFTFREGQGGGQRVSATTLAGPGWQDALPEAEARMDALEQPRLFMIRDGEDALDKALAARGYRVKDPVNLYACPIGLLSAETPPRVSTFAIWEPLAIQLDIWRRAGIGPGRWEVMRRATCPRAAILGRWNEKPAGTAYVGIHEGIAMLHALEVLPHQRRQGVAGRLMAAAAIWAEGQGAHTFSVLVTQANDGANALYASLGMTLVGQYHYRIQEDAA